MNAFLYTFLKVLSILRWGGHPGDPVVSRVLIEGERERRRRRKRRRKRGRGGTQAISMRWSSEERFLPRVSRRGQSLGPCFEGS
jgi:hypothetical protein